MDLQRRQRAFEAFERMVELPMAILALVFVPLLIIPLVMDLADTVEIALLAAGWAIWAAFALELAVKTYLAPKRGRYLRTHWTSALTGSTFCSSLSPSSAHCASYGRRGPCASREVCA